MELTMYVKPLLRRWWLVVAPLVVVLVYLALTYSPPPTVYQVVMRFAAGTPPVGLSEDYDRYYPWLASEYVARALSQVAGTGAFAEAVSARLAAEGVTIPAQAIQGSIVTDYSASIAVVYLTWGDPEGAVAIAEAITAELSGNAAAYYPQVQDVEPAVRRLDSPRPAPLSPGLRSQLMGPALRVMLALAVGVALALLWHYLDPAVREAADVQALGIDVLGEIPRG